jgi:Asp-tRNA(Asn)/Glu-tRNA(Gln) amidotransferase B subunit
VMNELAAVTVAEPAELAKVIRARDRIPRNVYLEAIEASSAAGFSAETYLAQTAIGEASELAPLVERILAANPGQVEAYRGGKEGLLGFFVGQVMKETNGKADPKVVNELLRERLTT